MAAVRPMQLAAELEIIRWVGEDHVDRGGWQRLHGGDAIVLNHPVECKFCHTERPLGGQTDGAESKGQVMPLGADSSYSILTMWILDKTTSG
jgi:hypothetical protein